MVYKVATRAANYVLCFKKNKCAYKYNLKSIFGRIIFIFSTQCFYSQKPSFSASDWRNYAILSQLSWSEDSLKQKRPGNVTYFEKETRTFQVRFRSEETCQMWSLRLIKRIRKKKTLSLDMTKALPQARTGLRCSIIP